MADLKYPPRAGLCPVRPPQGSFRNRIRVIMAPAQPAPDSNALRVSEGMPKDVERLLGRSEDLEALAGAAVGNRDHQLVRHPAPEQGDLDSVR